MNDLPGVVGAFSGVVFMAGLFGYFIVKSLTRHQREMAEIIHGKSNQVSDDRIARLESEVSRLRDQVTDLTIKLDDPPHRHLTS